MTEINYQKAMDDLRSLYKREAKVDLDDELLHLFIRMNSLQNEIKKCLQKNQKEMEKRMDKMERIKFSTPWDYFVYGLGKALLPSLLILTLALLFFTLYYKH